MSENLSKAGISKVSEIRLADIVAEETWNSRRRRGDDNEESTILELMASIKERGLIEPIAVRPMDGRRYFLVFGFRRYRAMVRLGVEWATCVVRVYEKASEARFDNLVENVQRDDLPPYDFAKACQDLRAKDGYSYDEIGKKLGVPPSYVHSHVRCLERFPADVLTQFMNAGTEARHMYLVASRETDPHKIRQRIRQLSEGRTGLAKNRHRGKRGTASGPSKAQVRKQYEALANAAGSSFRGRVVTGRERELAAALLGWAVGENEFPLVYNESEGEEGDE